MSKDRISPLDEFKIDPGLEYMKTDDKTTIVLSMTRKAYDAYKGSSETRDIFTFRYTTALIAYISVVASDGISFSSDASKITVTLALVSFTILASIDVTMKQKSAKELLLILIHLENILGCYSKDAFVEGTTLLPTRWLNGGRRVVFLPTIARLTLLWLLAAAGGVATLGIL